MSNTTVDLAKQLTKTQQDAENGLAERGAGDASLAFVREVSTSALFQYDLGTLLSAAPTCISLMGSCYVAASSPDAAGIMLKRPTFGTFVGSGEDVPLKECLIKVSDEGGFTFIEAEKKMDLLSGTSDNIAAWMTDVGDLVGRLPAEDAKMNLDSKLELIQKSAQDCHQYAKDVETKFLDWLKLVCAVHQAAAARDETANVDLQKANETLIKLATDQEAKSQSIDDAKQQADEMKKRMDDNQKLFQKAADAIPSPLEAVGIQLVAGLGNAITSTISQALPTLIGIVSGGAVKVPAGGQGAGDQQNGNQRRRKFTSQINVSPLSPDDPAPQAAQRTQLSANMINTLVGTGTTTGINWDSLVPSSTPEASKNTLTAATSLVNTTITDTQWTNGQASTDIKSALGSLLNVCQAIADETKQLKSLNYNRLTPDNEKVKAWQATVSSAKAKIDAMATTAATMPGGSPNALSAGRGTAPGANADPTGCQAALQSAQDKLATTEKAYEASLETYNRAVDQKRKLQGELDSIRSALKQMELSKTNLQQILAVLRQCIGILIQLKEQITNLVNFFSALSAMVERVVKTKVVDFMNQIETAEKCKIGGISLGDMSRRDLYTITLVNQAYFGLFSNIARMYCKISIDYVKPGLQMCNGMAQSITDKSGLSKRMNDLNNFTDSSHEAVNKMVSETQAKIKASLSSRVDSIKKTTKMLLPSPSMAAITQGAKVVTDAAATALSTQVLPIQVAAGGVKFTGDDY